MGDWCANYQTFGMPTSGEQMMVAVELVPYLTRPKRIMEIVNAQKNCFHQLFHMQSAARWTPTGLWSCINQMLVRHPGCSHINLVVYVFIYVHAMCNMQYYIVYFITSLKSHVHAI